MLPQLKRQEAVANNLANVSTPGYKKDMVFTQELTRAQAKTKPSQTDWQTPMIDQVYTQFTQGSLDKTGNNLDLAIEGTGFFVVEADDGTNFLTRSGNFVVDGSGYIADAEGNHLLSEGGPINVAEGEVSVSESGQVEVDREAVSTIRVVDVEDTSQLRKTGKSGFVLPEGINPIPAVRFAIRQGYLETSNVDIIKEMVDMIISYRNYESDANSLKIQDETLEKLINNVGRIR
jgi:flagellar basal-body rod protein FlgG